MANGRMEIVLAIEPESSVDNERLEMMTNRLRDELRELDINSIDHVSTGPPPKDSMAGDMIALGQLFINVMPIILPSLIDLIRDWIGRNKDAGITIKINDDTMELKGSPTDKEIVVLKAFIERHMALPESK